MSIWEVDSIDSNKVKLDLIIEWVTQDVICLINKSYLDSYF